MTTLRSLASTAAAPALIGLVALVWGATGGLGPSGPADGAGSLESDTNERSAPSEDVRALLGTLREGEEVGGFVLREVLPLRERRIPLLFVRGDAVARLWIVGRGALPFEPPAETERYAVIYRCDEDAGLSAESCGLLSMAVAERLEETEGRVPVPRGMEAGAPER